MQNAKRTLLLSCILLVFSQLVFSQKVGVVLSGGGAAGAAHVGVLKALEENEIPIDFIVGTSIGAVVGAFYASGYSPEEIESIMLSREFQKIASGITDPKKEFFFKKSENNPSIINFNFDLDSTFSSNLPTNFVSSSSIDYSLMEYFSPANAASNRNFDSLMIPFRCIAANVTKREEKIFKKGDLATAVRASMTFPFYIAPISIDGDLMFDGGIYNNFPVNILCEEFEVDYIIASNVADVVSQPKEDDLVSQLRSFFMQPSNFEIPCKKGIIINSNNEQITTFDFYQSAQALQNGYISTYKVMDSIKKNVKKRIEYSTMQNKRGTFNKTKPALKIGEIHFEGFHKRQAKYFKAAMQTDKVEISSKSFEKEFFKLNSNEKIISVQPIATFNDSSGLFDINLKVKKNKKYDAAFGGVIATNPFSSGFIELGYKSLKSTEFRATGNVFFGNFYNSAQAKVRWDVPFDIPFFISSQFTVNRFDYFGNGSFLIEESNPPFIISSERFWNLNIGLPIFNQGKLTLGSSIFWQEDEYHQTDNFLRTDTADFTEFNGYTTYIEFEANSLNRKQFANKGSRVEFRFSHQKGKETTIPGTLTKIPGINRKDREWIEINLQTEHYFLKKSDFHFGTSFEINYSELPLFQNFKATLLRSNAFSPILLSETRFIENLRAKTYFGAGLMAIYSIRDYIDFRLEGHFFQPYETFNRKADGSTELVDAVIKRNLISTFTAVYHSRVGPLAISLNYFDTESPNLNLLVHFGYVLFNNSALR